MSRAFVSSDVVARYKEYNSDLAQQLTDFEGKSSTVIDGLTNEAQTKRRQYTDVLNELKSILATAKAKRDKTASALANAKQVLARTPSVIVETYVDENGNSRSETRPNPAYYEALNKVNELDNRLRAIEAGMETIRQTISATSDKINALSNIENQLNNQREQARRCIQQLQGGIEATMSKTEKILNIISSYASTRL